MSTNYLHDRYNADLARLAELQQQAQRETEEYGFPSPYTAEEIENLQAALAACSVC